MVGCADKDHVQGRLPFVYIVLKADTTAKKKQVIRELEVFKAEADVILANRCSADLNDVLNKVYTRDLYFRD